ncbi:fatty acid desaturase [Vibrio astriarenae]|nr:fatty acid desaturase [Vibrio sp. C7]
MLRNYNHDHYSDYSNCRDLQKDKVVMWQHKYYVPLAIATNVGIPLLLGVIYGDIIGMLLVVGVLRLVLSHHSTFFINSLAHIWGSQPYTTKTRREITAYWPSLPLVRVTTTSTIFLKGTTAMAFAGGSMIQLNG